ncbi:MAG: PaaI family thioesterase [Candidatus Binatia bacterium]
MGDAARTYAMQPMFGTGRDEMVAHVPHCVLLGIRVQEIGPSFATVRLPWNENLIGDPVRGVVFGGVITTLLDQASGIAVQCSLPEFMTIATLDLRIDYLRAAEPRQDLVARAECYKLTSNVAFVRGSAWDRDSADPFASMLATFMLVGPLHPDAWQKAVAKGEKSLADPERS